jgi:hypothetical protein
MQSRQESHRGAAPLGGFLGRAESGSSAYGTELAAIAVVIGEEAPA